MALDNTRICVMDYLDNPLGFLDNVADDCLSYYNDTLKLTIGTQNIYTFEFSVLSKDSKSEIIKAGGAVAFTYRDKEYYCKIMKTVRSGEELEVTCWGLTLEMTNEQCSSLKPFTYTEWSTGKSYAVNAVVKDGGYFYKCRSAHTSADSNRPPNTTYWYAISLGHTIQWYIDNTMAYRDQRIEIGINEIAEKSVFLEFDDHNTVLKRLQEIAAGFNAELEFLPQLSYNHKMGKLILNILDKEKHGIGEDRTAEIIRYEDLEKIEVTEDITDLATAVRPIGKNGIMINSLDGRTEGDFKVIGSYVACPKQRDLYPATRTGSETDRYILKVIDCSDITTVEELYQKAKAEIKKSAFPKKSYSIKGYIDANLGDSFTVEDKTSSVPQYIEARIMEQTIHLTDSKNNSTTLEAVKEYTDGLQTKEKRQGRQITALF